MSVGLPAVRPGWMPGHALQGASFSTGWDQHGYTKHRAQETGDHRLTTHIHVCIFISWFHPPKGAKNTWQTEYTSVQIFVSKQHSPLKKPGLLGQNDWTRSGAEKVQEELERLVPESKWKCLLSTWELVRKHTTSLWKGSHWLYLRCEHETKWSQ